MAQKITITIPEELFERLEGVKSNFNVSGVCQEAIRQEVNRQELLTKENGKMKDVIERLKVEKQDYDTKYRDMGFNDGYEIAKQMHFKELVEMARCNEEYDKWEVLDPNQEMRVVGQPLNKFLKNVHNRFKQSLKQVRMNDLYVNEEDYRQGWLDGVKAFWIKVKDKLLPEKQKKSKRKATVVK